MSTGWRYNKNQIKLLSARRSVNCIYTDTFNLILILLFYCFYTTCMLTRLVHYNMRERYRIRKRETVGFGGLAGLVLKDQFCLVERLFSCQCLFHVSSSYCSYQLLFNSRQFKLLSLISLNRNTNIFRIDPFYRQPRW